MSDNKNKKHFPLPAAAFLVTAFLYMIICIFTGFISPAGINIYKGNNYYEYLSFISSFLRVLKGEESFWYSFSLFAGSPMAATYMHCCMSPFNLLYLIPGISMVTMSLVISILKAGCAAASFAYFAGKRSKTSPMLIMGTSLAWALSSYSVMCFTEYMYADILYILPFLAEYVLRAADVKVIKTSGKTMTEEEYNIKKKYRFDLIILILICGFMFLTGYHTAIAAAVFSLFLFAAVKIKKAEGHIKDNIFLSFRFLFALITGAGLTAILLVPTFFYAHEHPIVNPFALDAFAISIPELLTAFFQGSANGSASAVPYIYCGLAVLFILPSYIADKNTTLKEKLLTAVLFFICLLFPAPFLSSFCMIFLMLMIILEKAKQYKENKKPVLTALICIFFYALMMNFENITGAATVSRNGFYINGLFIILWAALFIAINAPKLADNKVIKKVPLLLLCLELIANSYLSINSYAGHAYDPSVRLSVAEETQITNQMTALKEALPKDADDLYRVRIDGIDNINAAAYYGFNTLSSKSIFPDDNQTRALRSLGVPAAYDTSADVSATPFGDDLFRVRYSVSGSGTGDLSVSENNDALPLAFLLPDMLIKGTPKWDADPLANQQGFINAVTGEDIKIYDSVSADLAKAYKLNTTAETEGEYTVIKKISSMIENPLLCLYEEDKEGCITYLYLSNAMPGSASPLINASVPGPGITLTADMNLLLMGDRIPYIPSGISLNEIPGKEYSHITLGLTASEHIFNNMAFLKNDTKAVQEASALICSHPLKLTYAGNTHIEGDIDVPADRKMLFTSIPYDKGWEASCDDEGEPVLMAGGGFCTLDLPEGVHHIILNYTAPGYVPGMIASFASLMILLFAYLLRPDKKKISSEDAPDASGRVEISDNEDRADV